MNKQIKIIVITVIAAFTMGFLLKDIIHPQEPIIREIPVNVPGIAGKTDTVYLDSIQTIKVPGKDKFVVDSVYYYKFLAEKDKTKQLEIFLDAIKVQDTTLTVEDNDTIRIDIWSKTRGKLLAQSANYFIKPRTVAVPVELPQPPRYEFYGGIFADVPTIPGGKFSAGVKLDLSIRNNSIYSLGYDTNGAVSFGVSKSIFNFK